MEITTLGSLAALMKIAKVATLTSETIPKVIETAVNGKIRLKEQAANELLALMQSSSTAYSSAFVTFLKLIEKARKNNDTDSLNYMVDLINCLNSTKLSEEHIYELIKQITEDEHERRKIWTKKLAEIVKMGLVSLTIIILTVLGNRNSDNANR